MLWKKQRHACKQLQEHFLPGLSPSLSAIYFPPLFATRLLFLRGGCCQGFLPAHCQLISQPVIVTGTESSKTCQLPASLAQLPPLVQGERHLKSSCHYSRAISLQGGPAELHTGSSYWQPQRRNLVYLLFNPNYLNCCKRNTQKTIACVWSLRKTMHILRYWSQLCRRVAFESKNQTEDVSQTFFCTLKPA